jgi:hypothetical protein
LRGKNHSGYRQVYLAAKRKESKQNQTFTRVTIGRFPKEIRMNLQVTHKKANGLYIAIRECFNAVALTHKANQR